MARKDNSLKKDDNWIIKHKKIVSFFSVCGLVAIFIYSTLFLRGWFVAEAFNSKIYILLIFNVLLSCIVIFKYPLKKIIFYILLGIFLLDIFLLINGIFLVMKWKIWGILFTLLVNPTTIINQIIYIVLFSLCKDISEIKQTKYHKAEWKWGMHILVLVYLTSSFVITPIQYFLRALSLWHQQMFG